VGGALVKHPLVKAVGFTGSRQGGRTLMDLAAARPEPIPVYAEMGSVNPVFILADALAAKAEEIATGLQGSVTLGVGQFCTNPGLVFIEAGADANKFLAKLETLMTATPAGTMLTPGLCAAYQRGVKIFTAVAGVRSSAASASEVNAGPAQAHATLFVTSAETFLGNHRLMDEVFGPSTLVVECGSREQLLAAAQQLEGQLTATIHTTATEPAAGKALTAVVVGKKYFKREVDNPDKANADGRFVAFEVLTPDDPFPRGDVYVKDMNSGALTRSPIMPLTNFETP
jgi:NADP-dependent aldehyde dehydrogenase